MKIVKDDLYFYNKDGNIYIVKANGKYGGSVFSGEVVFVHGNVVGIELGETDTCYTISAFKRLSNKTTVGEHQW